MEKSNKKIIIFFSVISIIVIMILIIGFAVYKYNNNKLTGQVMGSINNDEIMNQQHNMNFKNIDLLRLLNGTMPVSTTCKKIEKCIYTNLPDIFKVVENFSEKELSDYYKNNNDLKEKLYIDSEKSFVNLIGQSKNLDCDLIDDYDSCVFELNDNKIYFTVKYNNEKSLSGKLVGDNSASIAFSFSKDN